MVEADERDLMRDLYMSGEEAVGLTLLGDRALDRGREGQGVLRGGMMSASFPEDITGMRVLIEG